MWKITADFNEFPFDAVFFYSQEEKYYIEQLSTAMNLLQILVLSAWTPVRTCVRTFVDFHILEILYGYV